jgi:hypothetical protein
MQIFADDVVSAVLRHMNLDHPDDNLLIARAFADRGAETATMVGLDHLAGHWEYASAGATHPLTVPWSKPIEQRQEIRREVVAIYDAACERLGITPRDH